MRNYKVEGIIIKRKNFGEADRLITIFSKEKGKLRLLAKGSRRPLSKLAGQLHQMNRVHFLVAKGRNLDIITGATALRNYDKKSLGEISEMFVVAEIIDRFLAENDPHPKIYDLIEEVLPKLAHGLILPYFKLNFLAEIGFSPELFTCVRCSDGIAEAGSGFDTDSGGVICSNCQELEASIASDTIKLMRLALENNLAYFSKIATKAHILEELNFFTNQMLAHKINDNLKSENFVTEIAKLIQKKEV